jgi:hypothetical protein
MDDELWFAYLDHVAQQEKETAAEVAEPLRPAVKAAASPFVCDEPPAE